MAIKDYFQAIADAIRTKGGTSALITPGGMPQAIADLPSGGSASAYDRFIFATVDYEIYQGGYFYKHYIYGTQYITDLDITLLYDASQGGETAITLLDSIANYDCILLQGIYRENRTSQYNATNAYENVVLNQAYFGGMNDKDQKYTCWVTFTDNTHASLSGYPEVIIYGMN